jgi:hypothetical protein
MKKIAIEIDPDSAKEFLATLEAKLSEKRRVREELSKDISKLEASAKAVSDQLQGENGERSPRGKNKSAIIEFLKKLPDGATLSSISRSTGISVSSTAYTLKNSDEFEFEKRTSLWSVK